MRISSRIAGIVAFTVTAALALAGCADASRSTEAPGGPVELDELVAAAQEEGALTIYDGGNEQNVLAWTKEFTDEYDIKVDVIREGGAALYERFSREEAAGNHQADVISVLDRGQLNEAVEYGWLAEYTPKDAEQLPAEFARSGYYYAVQSSIAPAIIYNTQNVTADELVQLRKDPWGYLGAPELKGRVSVVAPQSGRSNQALWYMYTDGQAAADYGWESAVAIAANTAHIASGTTLTAQAIVQGEFDFGLGVPDSYITSLILGDGAPVGFVQLDPAVEMTNGTAVSAGAPHPNAARLFLEWAASAEGVRAWARGANQKPIRSDVDDPRDYLDMEWFSERPGLVWTDFEADRGFLKAMSDGEYMTTWNETFGYSG